MKNVRTVKNVKPLALLSSLLAASPLVASGARVEVGSFAPGETLAPVAAASPQSDSRTLVKTVVPVSGRAVVDIPSTGSGTLLVWVIPSREDSASAMRAGGGDVDRDLETRLVTPSGRSIGPDADGGSRDAVRRFRIEDFGAGELGLPVGARQEALRVVAPEPGLHRLEVSAPDGAAVTIAAVELDSPVVMTSWASPLSHQPGEPVTVHARLADGGVPISGATLAARLAPAAGSAGEAVTLFDDGLHGDGAASDGHYAASAGDLADFPAGPVAIRVDAEGIDGRGSPFSRTGASGLVNERPGARLLTGSLRAEWVGEGDARVLRVKADAAVREGGEYRFDVLAGGATGADGSRAGLAWAELSEDLTAGPTELSVDLPAALLGDGPLHLDVRLLGLSRLGVAGRATLDIVR